MNRQKTFMVVGALSAAVAVAAGAAGEHALRARLEPRMLEAFETAARYQMYHALALIAVGWLVARAQETGARDTLARASGWLFVAGTLLFSGSLYGVALTGISALGAITPLGGVCFLAAWVTFALAAARSR